MSFDLSLILVPLSAATGAIWLIDYFVLSRPRLNRLEEFLAKKGVSKDEFQGYLNALNGNSEPVTVSSVNPGTGKAEDTHTDSTRNKFLEQAAVIYREPLPVEYAKSFFPILFAVLLLRSFLFEPFQIPSGSMIPTLNIGDFIVVNKFSYGLRLPVIGTKILDVDDPKRGDVMVFIPPHEQKHYIKRVIGLPGDHVRYANKTVYISNMPILQENAGNLHNQRKQTLQVTIGELTHNIQTDISQNNTDFLWRDTTDTLHQGWLKPEGMIVPDGHYFMMGDNRDDSEDSRFWGPVPQEQIVGKAIAVWMHKEPGWHLPTFLQNRLIKNAQ